MAEILKRRRRVQEIQGGIAGAEAEIKAINDDQERIRKNMAALDKASDLYKRYVNQLDEQETRIQALRTEVKRLQTALGDANRDLKTYLDNLTVES